jgi:hypothetical protein
MIEVVASLLVGLGAGAVFYIAVAMLTRPMLRSNSDVLPSRRLMFAIDRRNAEMARLSLALGLATGLGLAAAVSHDPAFFTASLLVLLFIIRRAGRTRPPHEIPE